MINFFITCDDLDPILGGYFSRCREGFMGFLEESEIHREVIQLSGRGCTDVNVDSQLQQLEAFKFIFIAYSHGSDSELVANRIAYVKSGHNSSKFTNALFYTNACSSGKNLGKKLVAEGCSAFIGYAEEINVSITYRQAFINCDNSGLFFFFGEDVSIFEAFEKMKNYFTHQADKLPPFDRAELIYARDALVFYGNRDLKITDLANI